MRRNVHGPLAPMRVGNAGADHQWNWVSPKMTMRGRDKIRDIVVGAEGG